MSNAQWDREQIEEKCKREWQLNTGGCRDEFQDVEGFIFYTLALASGQARVLGQTNKVTI